MKELAEDYDIAHLLVKQVNDLRRLGFTYEFIYRAIEKKDNSYFGNGLNLLFYKPYQEEGIAIAKAKGKILERQKAQITDQFIEEYKKWKAGAQTANETMKNTNTKRTTFYKLVNELEKNLK